MKNTKPLFAKSLLAGALSTSLLWASSAQSAEQASGPTAYLYGGYMYIDEAIDLDPTAFGGLGIGYRFDSPWEVELRHNIVDADAKYNSVGTAELNHTFLSGIYHMNAGADVQPYVMLGVGHQNIDSDNYLGDHNGTLANLGLGLKYFTTDALSIRTDLNWVSDIKDEYSHAALTLGFHYQFGAKATKVVVKEVAKPVVSTDDDLDGVPNQFDRCPGTASGVSVDANGCEIVLDDDKDGVPNDKDKCPNTSAGALVDEMGCYIIITETKEENLYISFETNSATIRPESYSEIDEIAEFMTQYPLTKVVLEGHSDDRGAAAYNLSLSRKRAESVADYLTNVKGISPTRVSSTGFGESRPLVPNTTAENLAKNRRVTAKVSAQVETIKK